MEVLYKALFSIVGVGIASFLLHVALHALVDQSMHSKPVARVIGLVIASFGAFLALTMYEQLREIPKQPQAISIDQIVDEMSYRDHLWVSIVDGKWDCQNMAYTGKDTFAVLSNQTETLVIVASFDEKITCEDLIEKRPTGRLSKFVQRQFIYISNFIDFSRYESNTIFLSLCTYCGRSNSQIGLVVGIVFLVLGLLYDKVTISRTRNSTYTTARRPQLRDLMN